MGMANKNPVCHSHIHCYYILYYLVSLLLRYWHYLVHTLVILPLSSTTLPLSCTILCCCHYLVQSCVVAIILYNLVLLPLSCTILCCFQYLVESCVAAIILYNLVLSCPICVVVIILCNLVLLSLSCAILCCCHYLVQSCVVVIILCNLVLLPLFCAILCCCHYLVQYCVVTLSHILYCCQDTSLGPKHMFIWWFHCISQSSATG